MATAVSRRRAGAAAPEWARKYPPVAALAAAIAIALFVLPSSLNLPQSNPNTTVELAPVPPDSQTTPPQLSNLSTLSLGLSPSTNGSGLGGSGAGSGLAPPPPPPPPIQEIHLKTPSTKNCVGDPPRQTEDPLSPPCVADFTGDNGGATYQGVTGTEVKVLIYEDGGIQQTPTPRGSDTSPTNQIVDLDKPPQPNEEILVTINRNWEHYFNSRYQTYARHVHFFVQFSSEPTGGSGPTPESRAADAAFGFAQVAPFAIVSFANFNSPADKYLLYMAEHGVLDFGSVTGRSSAFYAQFPSYIWGYPAPIERGAEQLADYVCRNLVPGTVSFSGSGTPHGGPRKFGLVETSDPSFPNVTREAELVKTAVRACGAKLADADVVQFPINSYAVDANTSPQYAVNNMLKLKADNVTTILWPGGIETRQSAAATQLNYFPEWMLGDDPFDASSANSEFQDQSQWADAFIVTSVTDEPVPQQQICYSQYKQADPNSFDADTVNNACPRYNDLRQLFTGIQVAGPKLGAFSINRGFHAIPDVPSTNPQTPACFYLPNDYTCVKDSIIEFWNPNGAPASPTTGSSGKGCWVAIQAGKRYLPGSFPPGDPTTYRNLSDTGCNQWDNGQTNINLPNTNNPP
jgi:hypothetical protein